jgi:hypothetical protein
MAGFIVLRVNKLSAQQLEILGPAILWAAKRSEVKEFGHRIMISWLNK